jgi:hypothetical protein
MKILNLLFELFKMMNDLGCFIHEVIRTN